MQRFSYVARAQDGSLSRGTIEARGINIARSSLLQTYTDILDLEALPPDAADTGPAYRYLPLVETLRLYCGWLFALLFVLYGVGAPLLLFWHVQNPLLREWVLAPLFNDVALAAFLFLLATALHKAMRGGMILALLLCLLSMAALALHMAAPLRAGFFS